jgi:hypothetical protein
MRILLLSFGMTSRIALMMLAGQQLDRELRTWITWFQLTVNQIDDFASLLNTYKTVKQNCSSGCCSDEGTYHSFHNL